MALTAPQLLQTRTDYTSLAIEVGNSQTMFAGGFAALADASHGTSDQRGRTKAWAAAVSEEFIGITKQNPASTVGSSVGSSSPAAGTARVQAPLETAPTILQRYAVTGVSAQSDVGKSVYASDDATLTLTAPSTNAIPVGMITRWHVSTTCDVLIFGWALQRILALAGGNRQTMLLGIGSAGAATGNMATGILMPFHGKIISCYGIVIVEPTDADVVQTINLEIGGTNVTGGVITFQFDSALGTKLAGTAITAANEFHHGDLLDIETVATVAGTVADPGLVAIYAEIERLPGV